ncbi:hypothetical protein Peur_027217 [Populus x canadensis]
MEFDGRKGGRNSDDVLLKGKDNINTNEMEGGKHRSKIVLSEAWWIGTKEENPEELQLDFLEELFEVGQEHVVDKSGGTKYVEEESPETELDDDDNKYLKGFKEVMPIRQRQHA